MMKMMTAFAAFTLVLGTAPSSGTTETETEAETKTTAMPTHRPPIFRFNFSMSKNYVHR